MDEPEHAVAGASLPPLTEPARSELGVVLAELAQAQIRTYYDAAADQADTERYYTGVALDRLARLVTDTHRVRPRYQPATELYPWVDLQPDKTLRSPYTGHRYDPAELISTDFRIAEARRAERARLAALETGLDAAAVEDAVEAMLLYNCEHVVPQSWFGKAEPMRGTCITCSPARAGATASAATPRTASSPTSRTSTRWCAATAGRARATGSSRRTARDPRPARCSTSRCATPTRSARRSCHRTGSPSCSIGIVRTRCRSGSGTATRQGEADLDAVFRQVIDAESRFWDMAWTGWAP